MMSDCLDDRAGIPRDTTPDAWRVQMEALFQPDTDVETEFIEGDTPEEKAALLVQRLREEKII